MGLLLLATLRGSWTLRSPIGVAACCSLALGLSQPATGQARTSIDIPAGPLPASIALLSRQRGVSIGFEGRLPTFRARSVRGDMPTAQALATMLAGSGLDFEQLSPTIFRIVRRKSLAPTRHPAIASPTPVAPADIVVTGNKRSQSLATLPLGVSVLSFASDTAGAALGSAAIASRAEGLTLTNLGSGRNRQFIRGVADSPFNGNTQSTVSIQVDDARVTYNMPDPDLRLVDVARVEILKGPQGPLYGSGALGGVYHIVTRPPDLTGIGGSASAGVSSVAAGGQGGTLEAMMNLPLVTDRLGVRMVAYHMREPGWIDSGARRDGNGARISGGRIAVRARLGRQWTIDLGGWSQFLNVGDSQYVYAPGTRKRADMIAEPHDNDFMMASAVVRGRIGDADFLSSTSWVGHEVTSRLDASASAPAFGRTGALIHDDRRQNRLLDQELRLSRTNPQGLSWLFGLSFIQSQNQSAGLFTTAPAQAAVPGLESRQTVREGAAFAEATVPLSSRISVTAGARLFATWSENENLSSDGTTESATRKIGLSPSLAVSWRRNEQDFVYVRYAGALRPGGLSSAAGATSAAYHADELQTAEAGLRHAATGGFTLDANAYVTRWQHVQSDHLLDNGLVATRNAGDAHIYGVEMTARWRLSSRWSVAVGGTAQRALLTKPVFDLTLGDDRRLPVVPELTWRMEVSHIFNMSGWNGEVGANGNYIGSSRLSFDPGLDRAMGDYALASVFLAFNRDRWRVRANIDNLFDSAHDTFAFGNPFSIRTRPQYTPASPREVRLSVGMQW
ncbi:TonB-dependent receptor [Sphingobium sp. HBC34]|uniref:TonB-dependent receptor n=1 Tax=Sphingobium cyanobacteriorum TaxID=3063954 RepID=A0ABT8ZT78_9SPHN|nr:TonB-dependent receptor [Sphingobium sp. HBC34]MDO7837308.1 TonB-dependent receptor [Sphingobium sp. HBC34]